MQLVWSFSRWLWKHLVHVETVISPVLLVCFLRCFFPSLVFTSFLLTKLINMWGGGPPVEGWGWDRGYKSNSSWSTYREPEGFGERRPQDCRNSWVEVDSLAKPQNPQLSDCTPCFSDTLNDRAFHTQSFFWVWCWLVQDERGNKGWQMGQGRRSGRGEGERRAPGGYRAEWD